MHKLDDAFDQKFSKVKNIQYSDPCEIINDSTAIILNDKKPKWTDAKNKYVYNFMGRCNKASVKNTQLVPDSFPFSPENIEEVDEVPIYQFGRWDNNVFNIDFYNPFSILSAFALSLSIFDTN